MQTSGYVHSVNLNQASAFPYLVLDVTNDYAFPRNAGFRVMHWHEDLQLIAVRSGRIEVRTPDDAFALEAGEGIFINKNVVHLVEKLGDCRYNSFIFPDYFLKFYAESPASDLVARVTENASPPVFPIRKDEAARPMRACLDTLVGLEQRKDETYPYAVLTMLCSFFLALYRALPAAPQTDGTALHRRMRLFLGFIQQHYGEAVTLESIAQSAHVSPSECLRCFRQALQTSPYQYLTEYRLSKAAELLRCTDLPVAQIGECVGFLQPSHFGACFKRRMGCTPRAYRQSFR